MWGVFKSERLSWRCMWLLWNLPHLEVVIALDLWPERRIYSLLICANCQPSAITATSIGDMVALKSWNGSRAVSHKIAFGSAELSGRFTSKWDRISFPSWPMHLLMGWNYLSFFLTAWLSWPVHTSLVATPADSLVISLRRILSVLSWWGSSFLHCPICSSHSPTDPEFLFACYKIVPVSSVENMNILLPFLELVSCFLMCMIRQ